LENTKKSNPVKTNGITGEGDLAEEVLQGDNFFKGKNKRAGGKE